MKKAYVVTGIVALVVVTVFIPDSGAKSWMAVMVLMSLVSLALLVLGLVKPKIIRQATRKEASIKGVTAFFVFIVLSAIANPEKPDSTSKAVKNTSIEPNIKHDTKDKAEQTTVEAMMLKDSVNESVTCNQKLLSGTIFVGCNYVRADYQRQALFVVKDNKIQAITGSAMTLVEHALKYDKYTSEQVGYYLNMGAVNIQKAYVELNIYDNADSDFMDKPVETQGSDDNRQLIKEKERNLFNDITPIKQVGSM